MRVMQMAAAVPCVAGISSDDSGVDDVGDAREPVAGFNSSGEGGADGVGGAALAA